MRIKESKLSHIKIRKYCVFNDKEYIIYQNFCDAPKVHTVTFQERRQEKNDLSFQETRKRIAIELNKRKIKQVISRIENKIQKTISTKLEVGSLKRWIKLLNSSKIVHENERTQTVNIGNEKQTF